MPLSRRKLLRAGLGLSALALAGATASRSGLLSGLGDDPRVILKSKTGADSWRFVESQPSLDAGHGTLWAYLVDSASADTAVHWDRWPTIHGNQPPRIDDFTDRVLVVVVGIARPGYELDEVAPRTFDEDTITHTYRLSETDDYQNAPALSFHYDVIHWDLAGHSPPDRVELREE